MGKQRRIAEGLMSIFLLTEEDAYDKARIIDIVENYGDEVIDITYYLYDAEGDNEDDLVANIVRDLRVQCHTFANAITNLEAAFVGVKKRRGR